MSKQVVAKPKMPLPRQVAIFYAPIAALLLILFASSVWFNRYIFDTNTFTATASSAITSESSTKALATEITDRLLQDRPVLKQVLNDRVVTLLAALLETDLSDRVVQKSVSTMQTTITSKDPQNVEIDLTPIKTILSEVLTLGRQLTDRPVEEQRFDPNSLPDKIVLVNADALPNIYALGLTMMWLAPLLLLLIIFLVLYPLYRAFRLGLKTLKQVLLAQGVILFAGGLLALALGPLIKPPLLATVQSMNVRVVVNNLYDVFIAAFNSVAIWLIIVPSIILLLAALGIQLWPTIQRWIAPRTNKGKQAQTP